MKILNQYCQFSSSISIQNKDNNLIESFIYLNQVNKPTQLIQILNKLKSSTPILIFVQKSYVYAQFSIDVSFVYKYILQFSNFKVTFINNDLTPQNRINCINKFIEESIEVFNRFTIDHGYYKRIIQRDRLYKNKYCILKHKPR